MDVDVITIVDAIVDTSVNVTATAFIAVNVAVIVVCAFIVPNFLFGINSGVLEVADAIFTTPATKPNTTMP